MPNVLLALWNAWKKERIDYQQPPKNVTPIVFTRWVRTAPECAGWKDWNAAGILDREENRVVWFVPEEKAEANKSVLCAITAQQDIARAVAAGVTCGTIEYGSDPAFHLQWRVG